MGVPLVTILFRLRFSLINHPAMGGYPQKSQSMSKLSTERFCTSKHWTLAPVESSCALLRPLHRPQTHHETPGWSFRVRLHQNPSLQSHEKSRKFLKSSLKKNSNNFSVFWWVSRSLWGIYGESGRGIYGSPLFPSVAPWVNLRVSSAPRGGSLIRGPCLVISRRGLTVIIG